MTKTTERKRYASCDFQKRHRRRFPDDEIDGLEEVITYHTCSLIDAGLSCTYTAKFCRYKKEMEDIAAEANVEAMGEGPGDDEDDDTSLRPGGA